ncbi:lysophospholipid acyltransferase family protein [Nocardioides jiangxiensis]|uniref:Lysophospholipid acyltransferase family protein n=1 Tax=Nocardioides jiangxiensis TaxID=3064524 RepID=A0ABT9B4Y5_9ACTN|nr:lysophospholipid acyltransferase family protein [Nocardioides sp. WY-20]MDO7869460.1 lysophospholipid acyltransferase family protein [Nocardioides sp. WY-20]
MTEPTIFDFPTVPGWNRVWWASARALRPLLVALTRTTWSGTPQTPAEGGAIIALNHISQVDPILTTHFMIEHEGRVPSFLAKESLFRNRWVGWWFRATDHVPVDRSAGGLSIGPAVEAVRKGAVILAYVEGTITRDPDGWPVTAKTGTARIALETGAPVIPVAQWGAQELMPAYSGRLRVRLWNQPEVAFRIGSPVDLSDLVGRQADPVAVAEATGRIMQAIVAELEVLRGESAPVTRFSRADEAV